MSDAGMSNEAGVRGERLSFHSFDVDFKRRATVAAICRYFLDAAWNHAEQLGVGYTQLAAQQRFWVLSRLLVKLDRFPNWSEVVTLNTWPRQPKGIFALRDFELLDASGRRIVAGVSAWLVLDAAHRRPQRLEKLQWTLKAFPVTRATDREPEKLETFPSGTQSLRVMVRYGDLDVNDHVNSVTYIGWLLDGYSLDFHRHHRLKEVAINYIGETREGESATVHTAEGIAGVFNHTIAKPGGEEVCRARLEWERETS
jgi:medium-chain acyl-[acyl-carrier-protein] hydrolase